MRNLESMTKSSMGYKTRRGAQKQFACADVQDFLGFVLAREDGTFVPVAILNSKNMFLAHLMATNGIFVFNG